MLLFHFHSWMIDRISKYRLTQYFPVYKIILYFPLLFVFVDVFRKSNPQTLVKKNLFANVIFISTLSFLKFFLLWLGIDWFLFKLFGAGCATYILSLASLFKSLKSWVIFSLNINSPSLFLCLEVLINT